MGEVLLGRPFLKYIGFNPNKYLLEVEPEVIGKPIDDLTDVSLK